VANLKSSLRTFYCFIAPVFSSIMTYHLVWNKSTTTGVASGAVTTDSSGAHKRITGLSRVRVIKSLVFCVVLHRSLIVILPIYFWSLCTISLFYRYYSLNNFALICSQWIYMSHVSYNQIHDTLTTRWMISSRTDSPPAKVSTQW
jgi:hypothetical protein